MINELNETINKLDNYLKQKKYFDKYDIEKLKKECLIKKHSFKLSFILLHLNKYLEYKKIYKIYKDKYSDIDLITDENNTSYINKKIAEFNKLYPTIENRTLDKEQLDTIVMEDKNQLVLAGAGCGKTTTIVGKVKYLTKMLNIDPKKILLLSFTNNSASELKQRIEKEINDEMNVYTFHKLGLEITKQGLNNNIKIFNDIESFVSKELVNLLDNEEYALKVYNYIIKYMSNHYDDFNFKTKEQRENYLKEHPYITLKGEKVKSLGEKMIANQLFFYNIDYIYEAKYKDLKYYPDFYIKNTNTYIEYYGIDRNNNVAPWMRENQTKYNDDILLKRQTHNKYNTNLIELFYYDFKENNLEKRLKEELLKNNIPIKEKSFKEIVLNLKSINNSNFNKLTNIIITVINHIKSNNLSIEEVKDLINKKDQKEEMLYLLDIIEPIYNKYTDYLINTKQIDFNDMINDAIDIINTGEYKSNFEYVIVDEFQDISIARYKLLQALRNSHDYKLFCVGDDYQSIYRFNGSDISLLTHFEDFFGLYRLSFINTTHRFSTKLANISGYFINKNPNQIQKRLKGFEQNEFPLNILDGYREEDVILKLKHELDKIDDNAKIYLLGRYNKDINYILKDPSFKINQNTIKYKNKKLYFLSIHKSKGLEADYVFLINLNNRGNSFPSEISDNPLVDLFLKTSDNYPYSEERRLFYVALTRARKKVYLMSLYNNKSVFINEIEHDYQYELDIDICPKCNSKLIKKVSKYGEYLECSNYKECNYKKNIKRKNDY